MRRSIKVLAALGLSVSMLTACGGSSEVSSESQTGSESQAESTEKVTDVSEMYTVTMAYIGNEQTDMAKVEEKMNEILAEEVGAQIHIMPLGWGSYQQQLQLMLSGGEKLDIVPVLLNNANSYVSSGQVIDMGDLIDQYGTNIKASLGEDMAKIYDVRQITEDAHIADDREMFIEIEHPLIGKMIVNGSPVKLMDMMPRINIPAPTLGQHNEEIYVDLLHYTEKQLEQMKMRNVI